METQVDLFFADAKTAALCNSKREMTARWGARGFATVSRRLNELAVVDWREVAQLPATVVQRGEDGAVTIDCDRGGLTIEAIPLERNRPTDDIETADGLRIVTLVVREAS